MKNCRKKIKNFYKKLNKGFHRYVNGTKGVISLFLAILMVPFATIAGSLINAARMNSAIAVFDEALCNASNSTLGTYDDFLRKRFGLLAMSQKPGLHGPDYTAQDLISETFTFYMEQNLGALSNTYTDYEVDATGVYPLSDTDVLLSQVMEAGKYTVPAKLVIDGLSLDDLLSNLTKSLNLVSSIFNTISSGADMVDKFSDCETKLNALKEAINTSETARTEYDSAHTEFVSAVNAYNALIDEINQKIAEKQAAVDSAETEVTQCQATLDAEAEKISDLLEEIADMENEKDANGNKVDNTEKIAEYKETHSEEMAAYNTAVENLATAEGELTAAQTALDNVISSYAGSLSEKRTAVTTAKSTYATKIGNFATALYNTGDAVFAAQSSVSDALNAGGALAGNVVKTIHEGQKQAIKNQIKDMENSRDAAGERGDNVAKYLWEDKIEEEKEKEREINNQNVVEQALINSPKVLQDTANEFLSQEYQEEYTQAYGRLVTLKGNVESYVVSTDSTTRLSSTDSYYEAISVILPSGDVQKLQENLANEVAHSSLVALIEAVVKFVNAIFELSAEYKVDLCANIDTNKYSSIGGLPSMKDRTDGSQYSLKSEFADVDQQKSEYYKNLLEGYSNNPPVVGEATFADVVQTIRDSIDTFSNLPAWTWSTVFSNLKTIVTTIGNIISTVISFVFNLVSIVVSAVSQKLLLAGYLAYNTANRTTYDKGPLIGGGYSLPDRNSISERQGYAFYGAETEYLISGEMSEKTNQTNLFYMIYLLRFVLNIACIASNGEVATLAGEAGAATFGIGTVAVYVLYFIIEPFVDTLILVNSGSIPVLKTTAYLTPSGIDDLISKFLKISLSPDQKNKVYKEVVNVATLGEASDQFAENYADAVSSGIRDPELETGNAFTEAWDFDYTKTLILLMTIFMKTDTLMLRFSDIVQMESTYNAVINTDRYTFDLDQSYTYLRASGTFEANEFIKMSDGTGLNSKERVVYRGY